MPVMRSIPLFSIATWACCYVGTGTVGGLPDLSTWSQCRTSVLRHRRATGYRPSEIIALPDCCRSGAGCVSIGGDTTDGTKAPNRRLTEHRTTYCSFPSSASPPVRARTRPAQLPAPRAGAGPGTLPGRILSIEANPWAPFMHASGGSDAPTSQAINIAISLDTAAHAPIM